jgi:hypothetical protein
MAVFDMFNIAGCICCGEFRSDWGKEIALAAALFRVRLLYVISSLMGCVTTFQENQQCVKQDF